MHLLKAITVSAGWLSGSAAGIGLVLYAWGYLITRSQLNLLGIDGFVSYSGDQFVQEGSKFLIFLGGLIINRLFDILWLVLVVAAVVLVFAVPVRVWRGGLYAKLLARMLARVNARVTALARHLPWPLGVWVYLVLLLLLVNHLSAHRGSFTSPLGVVNVLYSSAGFTFGDPKEKEVATDLLAGNTAKLKHYFDGLVYAEIQAALLLLGAWYATRTFAARKWLITPFAVVVVLYTVYLPMTYGVLVRPVRHHLVTLHLKASAPHGAPATFHLLSRANGAFVVWDRTVRQVLWVPEATVERAEVRQVEPLFQKEGAKP